MMPIPEKFVAIMPRHQRLLRDLYEQRKYDPFGGIGWRGLMDEDEQFTAELLFGPLLERGLIEDCSQAHQSESGKYFVHITALGIACMNVGYLPKDARHPSSAELKLLVQPPPEPKPVGAEATP
jgi:hypothetical protein